MARRRKRELDEDEDLDDEVETPLRARRQPRRRWRLLAAFIALVALVIGAPAIISKTPLRNFVLTTALPAGSGRLTVSDASFSWTSSQSLTGVALVDSAGAPLFSAEQV